MEALLNYAEHMVDGLNILVKTSKLPTDIDYDFLADLIIKVQDTIWNALT